MKKMFFTLVLATGLVVTPYTLTPTLQMHNAQAITCSFTLNYVISGPDKICYYDCDREEVTITVPLSEYCPLTIER